MSKGMKINRKNIIKILKNKYFITIAIVIVWMSLDDTNGFVTQYRLYSELLELRERKVFLMNKIEENKQEIDRLINDREYQEKLARENYLMKRENEEIFIFEPTE